MAELLPWQQAYVEFRVTRAMSGLPRFGHSSEFAMAFGSEEQKNDYIFGLLFAGIFIIAFFLVWTILIPIFMCLGQRKIGFLSGHAFQVPYGSKKPMIYRTVFLIATITLIIFSSLLVTKGLTQLNNGMNTLYDNAVETNRIISNVERFLDTVAEISKVAVGLRNETVSRLGDGAFCPGGNLSAATGEDFGMIPEVVSLLNGLRNFSQEGVADAQVAVDQAADTGSDVENTFDDIQVNDWQSLIFIIPFSIFCFVFIVGALLAWFDKSFEWLTCLITWFVLPLFFVLIIVCWACAGAIAIGASANADFCAGGADSTPGSTITQIMELNGFSQDDMLFRVTQFYIGQCINTNDPLGFLKTYASELDEAQAALSVFREAIVNTTIDTLVEICGEQDYQTIADLAQQLNVRFGQLLGALTSMLSDFSCQNIVPLYTSTFYDGTCEYSVKGLTWCFSAFIVVSIMGMLMITFRSSLRPTLYEEDVKFNAPIEYVEEHEVEYVEPSRTEQSQEGAYGLEGAQSTGGVDVVTGLAVGAAANEAINGERGSLASESPFNENPVDENTTQLDDGNWLDIPPTSPEPPTAPN